MLQQHDWDSRARNFWHPGETVNIKVRKKCKPVSEFSTKTPNTRRMPVNIQ